LSKPPIPSAAAADSTARAYGQMEEAGDATGETAAWITDFNTVLI